MIINLFLINNQFVKLQSLKGQMNIWHTGWDQHDGHGPVNRHNGDGSGST